MTNQASAARDGWVSPSGGDVRFHYREWGDVTQAPVLLLHGFSEQARSYDTLAADLADRFHVVALDQRGHGESDWSTECRWQTFVDDIRAVIDALRLGPTSIVGHSMGGTFGALFAAHHPTMVSRLVVIDQAPGAELSAEALHRLVPIITRPDFDGPQELIRLLRNEVPRYRTDELHRSAGHLLR